MIRREALDAVIVGAFLVWAGLHILGCVASAWYRARREP